MITREEAARIAALAKLELTGEELDRAARELGAILDFVEQIEGVDTSGVDIDRQHVVAPLRDDVPAASLAADDAFANAPDADRAAQLFRVPRVLGS